MTDSNETTEASFDRPEPNTTHEPTEEQRKGAVRTALFFVAIVLILSLITTLSRVFGW